MSIFLMYSSSSSGQENEISNRVRSGDKRFIDNGNLTVTDSKTGLMWMQQDSYLYLGKWINWFESQLYIKSLNKERFAQFDDWRMPTMDELKTLYEPGKTNSKQVGREMIIHIDQIFAKEGCGSSWSVKANGRYNAFGIVYNSGVRFSHPKVSKSRKGIRAVRYAIP